ncbi:hypothetical protein BFW01_g553 [Lasiodiplodia theobromae]|nr:hypothetical protein BFW01_g553 [Lasiodiplodia theobromae]
MVWYRAAALLRQDTILARPCCRSVWSRPVLQKPPEIPCPPPTEKERKDWDVQANKAKFRRTVENTHVLPAQTTLKARNIFKAGVYSLYSYNIWIQRRRTP